MQAREESVEIGALPVRFLEVNGASLAFVEKGEGDAVVFVHGPVCDLRIWLTQVELFSGKYRAVTYSRRTHWPAKDAKDTALYSRSSHAEDLICFLEALKLKKTHIVGHSYGGAVSLLAAIQRPDLIASLTLAEPSPFLGLFSNSDLDLVSRQKIGFDEARLLARLGNADASIRKFLSVTVGADVLDQLPPAARSVVIENISTLLPTLEHYYESPPVACEHLRRVTLPVLLMRGELSPRLALVGNTKLSECLPNSSEAVLDSTSHGLHIENPTEFGRVVLNFLNSLPPTAA